VTKSTTTRQAGGAPAQRFAAKQIALARLVEAEWNANRVSKGMLSKIRRSLERFGCVENLVARPHPARKGSFEVLSGNHRLRLLTELGYSTAPVVVVSLGDAQARLLAQTLNRTRGRDDPQAYAELLDQVLNELDVSEVVSLLPETEATIDQVLGELAGAPPTEPAFARPSEPRSRLGELYELGPHRLLCGDATSAEQVELVFAGERASLMATDPPYGVGVDHGWRDGLRQRRGSARAGGLANDDRCDWREAFLLTDAPVAYVWHSALHCREAFDGLEASGFEVRQQLIWVKQVHALSRAHYQWKHESCLYAVRKGSAASWQGGRKQSTVWEAPSPIMACGAGGDDGATAHPTQKPLVLFERPILNHTERDAVVYEPFAGSGTCLIAAEKTGRRCFAIEIDPAWCDVIRDRYAAFAAAGKAGS
jgi:DNA modification methylase